MGCGRDVQRDLAKPVRVALTTSKQCDGRIAAHASGAARQGATTDEVAEAPGVAVLMNGGSGTVHAPRAFAASHGFAGDDR